MTRSLALCSLAFATTALAHAEVIIFTDEAEFLATAPITETERFDEIGPVSAPRVLEINDLVFLTQGVWEVQNGCTPPISDTMNLGANPIEPRSLVFRAMDENLGGVHAVGLRLQTLALSPPETYMIAVFTTDGEVGGSLILDAVSRDPLYRGFLSTSLIQRVVIVAGPDGQGSINYCIDDVSHSAIRPLQPPPAP